MSQAPASLAQHFETPDGFSGHFGWLCGFSADDKFLNDALERFSHCQANQRAYAGDTLLALMLDPRAAQITPIEVPGLLHLPWAHARLPFNLMHAKVALLSYRSTDQNNAWCLRLLVSTGNWTRQTLEQSLDLVWRLDLHSDDLLAPSRATQQAQVDIRSAWELLSWLREYYDQRALLANPLTAGAVEEMDSFLGQWLLSSDPDLEPRFFDNREKSLLEQLPAKVVQISGQSARNYLAMGSGFYESSLSNTQASVPARILRRLRGEDGGPRLLTTTSTVDLFVNEASCQGVAQATTTLEVAGIQVRPAAQPGYFSETPKRTLHAKFIFSANETDRSHKTTSPWLYLGSGNLTRQGFTQKMWASTGNLEAGVVFAPTPLNWRPKRSSTADPESIGYYLPIQRDLLCTPDELQQGGEFEVGNEVFSAAPVAYFTWQEKETSEHGWLRPDDDARNDYSVLDMSGKPCSRAENQGFAWHGARPRQVLVSWQDAGTVRVMTVPVLDAFGRLAATELPEISLEDAWMQLDSFPQPPSEEELPDAFDDSRRTVDGQQGTAAEQEAARYPIRQMMGLIEGIATKQTTLEPKDWPMWCARLEQSLIQATDCELLKAFLALELNPLHALYQPSFRPHFAETANTPEGQRYESALQKIESHWNVGSINPLGGST